VPAAFQSVAVIGAEVVSISPLQAALNQPTFFTVTGKNLTAGMGFAIQDCEGSSQETPESLAASSATQRQFVCTPRGQIGGKTVTVKNFPDKTRPGLPIPEGYGVVQFITSPVLTVPYLKQQSISDIGEAACASASTAMVLAYHRKISADTNSMIEAAKTVFAATSSVEKGLEGRPGLANHLKEKWGFSSVLIDTSLPESLYETIKGEIRNGRPLILGSKSISGVGHYVVIIGYEGEDYKTGQVVVNDPYGEWKGGQSYNTSASGAGLKYNFVAITAKIPDGVFVIKP